jgi:hypothetical protein
MALVKLRTSVFIITYVDQLNNPSQTTLLKKWLCLQVRDVQGGARALHLPRDGDPLRRHPPPRGHQAHVPCRGQESHLL